jgi:hypothetical protein
LVYAFYSSHAQTFLHLKERFSKANDAIDQRALGGVGLDSVPTPGFDGGNRDGEDVGVQIFKKGTSLSSSGPSGHTFYLVSIIEFKSPKRLTVTLHEPRGDLKVSAEFAVKFLEIFLFPAALHFSPFPLT